MALVELLACRALQMHFSCERIVFWSSVARPFAAALTITGYYVFSPISFETRIP